MSDFKIEILDKMRQMAQRANIQKEVFCYYLKGSQNYGLDDIDSDIDMVCITVPSMRNMLLINEYSPTFKIRMEENSNENLITGIDIGDYLRKILTGNYTILESLFTPYVIINEKYADLWNQLKEMKFSFLKINPKKTFGSITGQAKSYFSQAVKQYNNHEINGKAVMNYFRMVDAANKYCNLSQWNNNFYEPKNTFMLKKIKHETFPLIEDMCIYYLEPNLPVRLDNTKIANIKKNVVNIFTTVVARGEENKCDTF